MADKKIDYSLTSKMLANCYLEYESISKAPQSIPELLQKYNKHLPNFIAMKPELRADAQYRLDLDIIDCKTEEMRQNYKSTDGVSVFLIKNPFIWPKGKKGYQRLKPKYLGPLLQEKPEYKASKRLSLTYNSDDDLD